MSNRIRHEPGKFELALQKGKEKMSQNIPPAFLSNEEKRILNSYPFFGGTSPDGGTTTTKTDEKKTDTTTTTGTATGTTTTTDEDPIAKLQSDPNALRDLLNQVSKATGDLANITKERDTLQTEKDKQIRSQQTKEQQLQTDLENAQATIEQQDRVIRAVAIQNAFQEKSGDIQWNSIKQALAELNEENYQIEVDLDNGIANVTGIENEVKRISKDFPWLVKSSANPDPGANGGRGPGRPPGTGSPPAPPNPRQGDKKQRRDGLMNRFPVLMQGR